MTTETSGILPLYRRGFMTMVLLAAVGSSAFAADEKGYPGTYCRPSFETTHNFGIGGGPSIYNKSTTQFLYVICPIVRDEMADYFPELKWAQVDYQNAAHPNTRLYCQLQARNPLGGTLERNKLVTSPSTGSPGFRTLHVQFDSSSLYKPGLFYQLYCTLPPSAGTADNQVTKLWGYRVREED
ncbi:MAG: hypothetical protein U9R74_00815 [Pseudomonadota bacterium]|nr:hypothetical protein [Pseudomonadota bacterium]